MADSNLILLLQLIARKADVEPLIKRGLRYSQISQILATAIKEGLVQESDEKFTLTSAGFEKMRSYSHSGRPRADGGWMSPAEEFRIKSQSPNKVFLPEPRKSFFVTREAD